MWPLSRPNTDALGRAAFVRRGSRGWRRIRSRFRCRRIDGSHPAPVNGRGQGSLRQVDVREGREVCARFGAPSRMHASLGAKSGDCLLSRRTQHVGFKEAQRRCAVEAAPVAGSAHDRVHLVAAFQELLDHPSSDESVRPRDDDLHVGASLSKSGYVRSRSERTRGSSGHWIPNAGSFHRTPRAQVGSKNSDIW